MYRTISAMVGKGSVNHNSRKFKAENVNGERSHLNMSYCNEPIKKVYHKLFDEALERYNARQTRTDRVIEDYYEKIRSGKQEKPFHELILQIGNREDTGVDTEAGERAKEVLHRYFQEFQQRNPNLYVFSAHLHMDEATPHLHIDFVPFTTGSKRGLDTRVSLKQALAAQGFKGGSRGFTEWTQWVESEKKELARIMGAFDLKWDKKGTHEEHLSVLDYKKQERSKELAAVEESLSQKKTELALVQGSIRIAGEGKMELEDLKKKLDKDPEYQLPEPGAMMSARTFRARFAQPLIDKLKKLLKEVLARYFQMAEHYQKASWNNRVLGKKNADLENENYRLYEENQSLRKQSREYALLKRALGREKVEGMLVRAEQGVRSQKKNWIRDGR